MRCHHAKGATTSDGHGMPPAGSLLAPLGVRQRRLTMCRIACAPLPAQETREDDQTYHPIVKVGTRLDLARFRIDRNRARPRPRSARRRGPLARGAARSASAPVRRSGAPAQARTARSAAVSDKNLEWFVSILNRSSPTESEDLVVCRQSIARSCSNIEDSR